LSTITLSLGACRKLKSNIRVEDIAKQPLFWTGPPKVIEELLAEPNIKRVAGTALLAL
jgi:hypothetical protein